MQPTFSIIKTYQLYCYLFTDSVGKILLSGNLYSRLSDCVREIEQVQYLAQFESSFKRYVTRSQQYSFQVNDALIQMIGQGALYNTAFQREVMLLLLRKEVTEAVIIHEAK